jgi:hypothetical protein
VKKDLAFAWVNHPGRLLQGNGRVMAVDPSEGPLLGNWPTAPIGFRLRKIGSRE